MASSSSSATDSSISDESQLVKLLSELSSDSSDSAYKLYLQTSFVHLGSKFVNLRYELPEKYDKRRRRDIFLRIIRATASSKVVESFAIDLDEESAQQTDFVKHIAEMIRANTSVKDFTLFMRRLDGMTLESAALIRSALSDNHALHTLRLVFRGHEVDSVDAEVLEVLLAGNHVLKSLIIGTDGRQLPATMLHGINNTSIRSLDLHDFRIGSADAATIGTALGSNDTLEDLRLWQVDMGADGYWRQYCNP